MSLPAEEMLSEGEVTWSWFGAVPLANKLKVMSHRVPMHFWICCRKYAWHNDATDLEDVDKSIL